MRWAGYVVRMGEVRGFTAFWWGNLRKRDQWGDPGVDGRLLLRWVFRNWDIGTLTRSSWLRKGTGSGHL